MKKHLSLMLLLFMVALAASGQERLALVIGNSSYSDSPLKNPVNDAQDVGAALQKLGFRVFVRINLDLEGMENSIDDFLNELSSEDTALVYYSGHGIQVEGQNYLIPISERIENQTQVKSRGLSLTDLLDRISSTGVSTLLVFLDSCRNNPIQSTIRGTPKGLSIVRAPKTAENLIAFAAEPGEVANDGDGRNGVFTEAFLNNVSSSDKSLTDIMTQVRADVIARTGGSQRPRVDSGLSKPFYFLTSDLALSKARAETERLEQELARLNADIAARTAQIADTKSEEERKALEREQITQAAFEKAKQLELQTAQREAERLLKESEAKKAERSAMERLAQSETARLAALKAEAEERRKVYLTGESEAKEASFLLKGISSARESIRAIESRYTQAEQAMALDTQAAFTDQMKAIGTMQRNPWESNLEFENRKNAEARRVEETKKAHLASQRTALEEQKKSSLAELESQLASYRKRLNSAVYTVQGTDLSVAFGEFDREAKSWPFRIRSTADSFAYSADLAVSIRDAADIATAFSNIDTAIKTNAILGEIDYIIVEDSSGLSFYPKAVAVRLLNLLNGETRLIKQNLPPVKDFKFADSEFQFFGDVVIISPEETEKLLLPSRAGAPPIQNKGKTAQLRLPSGEYTLKVRGQGIAEWAWSTTFRIKPFETFSLSLPPEAMESSMSIRIAKLEMDIGSLKQRIAGDWAYVRKVRIQGGTNLLVGAAGLGIAGWLGVLASQAYQSYKNAAVSADAIQFSDQTTVYTILSEIVGLASALPISFGIFALAERPAPPKDLETDLRKKILDLQILREKEKSQGSEKEASR